MARGGKRPGAGRPKGSKDKRSSKIEKAARLHGGLTPLAYMLKIMRDPKKPADRRDEMAKASARFVHPALNAIEHSGAVKLTHEQQLAQLE